MFSAVFNPLRFVCFIYFLCFQLNFLCFIIMCLELMCVLIHRSWVLWQGVWTFYRERDALVLVACCLNWRPWRGALIWSRRHYAYANRWPTVSWGESRPGFNLATRTMIAFLQLCPTQGKLLQLVISYFIKSLQKVLCLLAAVQFYYFQNNLSRIIIILFKKFHYSCFFIFFSDVSWVGQMTWSFRRHARLHCMLKCHPSEQVHSRRKQMMETPLHLKWWKTPPSPPTFFAPLGPWQLSMGFQWLRKFTWKQIQSYPAVPLLKDCFHVLGSCSHQ